MALIYGERNPYNKKTCMFEDAGFYYRIQYLTFILFSDHRLRLMKVCFRLRLKKDG
jgi:hypothetical protein